MTPGWEGRSCIFYILDRECGYVYYSVALHFLCIRWNWFIVRHLYVGIVTILWAILTIHEPMYVISGLLLLVLLPLFAYLVGLLLFLSFTATSCIASQASLDQPTAEAWLQHSKALKKQQPNQICKKRQYHEKAEVWYYIFPLLNGQNRPNIHYNSSCTEILAVINHVTWGRLVRYWPWETDQYSCATMWMK